MEEKFFGSIKSAYNFTKNSLERKWVKRSRGRGWNSPKVLWAEMGKEEVIEIITSYRLLRTTFLSTCRKYLKGFIRSISTTRTFFTYNSSELTTPEKLPHHSTYSIPNLIVFDLPRKNAIFIRSINPLSFFSFRHF